MDTDEQSMPMAVDSLSFCVRNSITDLETEWERFEQSGDCYAFQSYRWIQAWYETMGRKSGIEVCVVIVYAANGDPMMLIPLGVENRSGIKFLTWLGSELCDYHAPILCRGFASEVSDHDFLKLWKKIRKSLPQHDILVLDRQPEHVNEQRNPFMALRCERHSSSGHFVRLDADFDTFLNRKRSKKTLSTERRKRRRLAALGTIRFEIASDRDQIDSFLEAVFEQKSENYRQLGVTDLFAVEGYRSLVRLLSDRHIRNGFVHLSVLKLDDRIIAGHWGVVFKDRIYYLLPCYERSELTRYSPGNILLHELFEWCISHDIRICDFTVGDESYKLQWQDAEIALYDHIASYSLRGYFFAAARVARLQIKRSIKMSPALRKIYYRVRASLARMRRRKP